MKKYWEIVITGTNGGNSIWDAKNKREAHKLVKEAAQKYAGKIECITIQAHNGEEILDDTQITYMAADLLKK